jgi:hypothetical protein
MKNNIAVSIYIFLLVLFPAFLFSQSPQSIPYQAVVRNTDGTAMSNAALTMIFKIHDQSATGTVVYQESHSVTSNVQGLVICNVGNGTPTQGTFANINWGNGAKFLHVLMDAGNGELDLGTQQMMSVPYALYAEKSGGSVPSGSAPGELMYWNGEGWSSIPPGGYGQALCMCDGVPSWGGCAPKLGAIKNENTYFIISDQPDSLGAYYFVLFMLDSIISLGTLNVSHTLFPSPYTSGFEFSTDSLFMENYQSVMGSIQSGNGTSLFINIFGAKLYLGTTYYVRAFCQNAFGIGYSRVKSFSTPGQILAGCADINACNYNPDAIMNDGTCVYPWYSCDDNNANTFNDMYDGNCQCVGTP